MEPITIDYRFDSKQYQTRVSALQRAGHVQVTVWPLNAQLQQRFGARVFHKFPGKDWQAAFPADDAVGRDYTNQLAKALTTHFSEGRTA
jgi:hypothetical protein